jgi:hypothetical protein
VTAVLGRVGALAAVAGASALVACGGSSGSRNASGGRAPACHPPGAQLLAASRTADVFSLNRSVYGCYEPTGKRYKLGASTVCVGSTQIGPASVAGAIAAYGAETCGVDTGSSQVIVRRLSDGHVLDMEPAMTLPLGPESYVTVGAIVVKANGSAAWIANASSIVHRSRRHEVRRSDTAGRARLDSGSGINPSSLRLRGSSLSWRHGAATRSALLH